MPGAMSQAGPRWLPVGSGSGAADALPALRDLLDGRGPLLLPVAADPASAAPEPAAGAAPAPAEYLRDVTGIAVGTSGSTGTPKRAVLPVAALHASIEATHARLGGPGPWLLLLPAHHIAGLQVLLRSLAAGADPILPPEGLGTVAAVATAADALPRGRRWYTAVVPAQLGPLVDDPAAAAALRQCAAVLCGGAALAPSLRARAEAAGIRLVTTYGMSETAGGCVYDGTPLDGVSVEIADGRIRLGGPSIAAGYLDDPARSATTFGIGPDGARWFTTDDIGELDDRGRVRVLGRCDDVINTGGYKVHPAVVEAALAAALPPGTQVAVAGVPDPRWGQVVAAAVVPPPGRSAPASGEPADPVLAQALGRTLPRYAVPRLLVQVAALPLQGPGKVDRAALSALLAGSRRPGPSAELRSPPSPTAGSALPGWNNDRTSSLNQQ